MGNKVSKKNDIPEKNIWEYTMDVAPENSVEFVNKISAEPAEIKEQVERAKKLIVYTEDDLKDMVPFFIDKKTNGNLYIIAGKICKTELSETGANVTIKNRNEEKIFKINMEDSFYDKAMSAAGKDIYITEFVESEKIFSDSFFIFFCKKVNDSEEIRHINFDEKFG